MSPGVVPTANGCVFCRLTSTDAGSVVFEDDDTYAAVDPRQPHDGHVLVIPRRHVPTVYDLDEATGAAIMRTTVRVARAVRAALAPEGLSLWQSNGPAAFQEIPHLHVHVMPRWTGDGLLRIYPRRLDEVDRDARATLAGRIRAHLGAT